MYKRILIKISGEALGGEKGKGIDFVILKEVASEIKKIVSKGVEVGIVVGGRKLLERKDGKEYRPSYCGLYGHDGYYDECDGDSGCTAETRRRNCTANFYKYGSNFGACKSEEGT